VIQIQRIDEQAGTDFCNYFKEQHDIIMKKQIIILTAIAFALLATPVFTKAQNKVWSIGPEVGVNISKYGNNISNSDFKTGFLGGLFLTYSIENTHAFTAKFLFSQKGTSSSVNNDKQTLNYIEVPVIGRFFFNRDGRFRPNIFVGPSFGFLTGVRNKEGDNEGIKLPNYDKIYNGFDFGITTGLGFNYLIANETRFLIDARYTQGFSDITKASGEVNNKAFGVTAGVSFGL
jgi:hypothetical protein